MRKRATSNASGPTAAVVEVVVQVDADGTRGIEIPLQSDFRDWAAAVADATSVARSREVCVRIVGAQECASLNQCYRGASGPTNVLSFSCDAPLPPAADEPLPLGDIVISAPVVESEARAQNKHVVAHWAHLFVHGMLHLQGYDHADEKDAQDMEAHEVRILNRLGFSDPYLSYDYPSDG